MAKKPKGPTKTDLDTLAGVLKVHPRTVIRAVEGKVNSYWAPGHNPEVELADVALAYGVELDVIVRTMKGQDELFKPTEAVDHISALENRTVPMSTFRYRKYPAAIRTTGVVRYSKLDISNYHLDKIAEL